MTFQSVLSGSAYLFSSFLLSAVVALAPAATVEAQASGTLVITIEGTLGPAAPAAAPEAPSPPPPVVVVEPAPAPAAAPVLAPAPSVVLSSAPTVPAGYGQVQPLALDPELASVEAPRTRPRWGLVAGGAAMAIGAWGLNIGGSLLALALPAFNVNRGNMFFSSLVPVVGPLMQIGFRDADWQIPFFLASSALQIAGWIMAFVGTFSRVEVEPARADLMVLPYASGDGAGLTAMGSF